MINKYTFGIASLFFLVLGFCIKSYFDTNPDICFSNEISYEINPLEVISLMINIFLALYITNILAPTHEKNKKEIELISSYFQEFKNELNDKFNNISDDNTPNITKLSSDCKTLRRKLKAYSDIVVSSSHLNKDLINNDYLTPLKECMDNIWEELTDSPRIESNLDISKGETTDSVRLALLQRVEGYIIKIEGIIFKLILTLNRNEKK
jgi:hypothetical protein